MNNDHENTPAVDRTDRSINKAGEEVKIYGSLNEPPYAPEPFKADTEAAAPEAPATHHVAQGAHDPDELEDEIDEAEDDGDFKPTHRGHTQRRKK